MPVHRVPHRLGGATQCWCKNSPGASPNAAAGAKLVTIDGAVSDCVQLADPLLETKAGLINNLSQSLRR